MFLLIINTILYFYIRYFYSKMQFPVRDSNPRLLHTSYWLWHSTFKLCKKQWSNNDDVDTEKKFFFLQTAWTITTATTKTGVSIYDATWTRSPTTWHSFGITTMNPCQRRSELTSTFVTHTRWRFSDIVSHFLIYQTNYLHIVYTSFI